MTIVTFLKVGDYICVCVCVCACVCLLLGLMFLSKRLPKIVTINSGYKSSSLEINNVNKFVRNKGYM
jgi:hypothetical protein